MRMNSQKPNILPEWAGEIVRFTPRDGREAREREMMLDMIARLGDRLLSRENDFAHMTASSIIVSRDRKKTLMAYGSSITHGSNSIDQSHSWVSVLAHNLGMDVRNLGMAGSCQMEEAVVDYIAAEGEAGSWDAALLELGINVLSWPEEKYLRRVENTVRQIALRNPNKPIFVISPFFHCGEIFDQSGKTELRRSQMEALGKRMALENVTWINGRKILENAFGISADEVHPNIYGVAQIAQRLSEIIARKTGWGRRV